MKSVKKQNKIKLSGNGNDSELKPIKKLPSKTKVNVKSSKFWENIYDDDPELDDLNLQKR